MLELDIQDARLRSVVDPFENGNYKKALQEINKVLKKSPKLMSAKALKALTLSKLDRITEAIPLAEEVVAECPTDECTVSLVMCYFRETGQRDRVPEYLKSALEKCGSREDLLVCLFLSQVQETNFAAQQQTARQLSQFYSSRLYTYWVIVSTLMQAESDPLLGQRMFLPLAEKMLSRDADECKMETHIELQLLIELLERLKKPSQALALLNNRKLLDRLNSLDYDVDYSLDQLRLASLIDDWDSVFRLSCARLKKNPNEWNSWQCLIETAVRLEDWELCKTRVTSLLSLISDVVGLHSSDRGPQLAALDLLANAIRRNWYDYPKLDEAASLLRMYVDKFASKPICPLDVAYLVPLLLPDEDIRKQFIEEIVNDSEKETTVPGDTKQIYQRLCSYQISRVNRYAISMERLLTAYFTHVPERLTPPVSSTRTEDVSDRTNSLDLCPADGFLLLATSILADPVNSLSRGTSSVQTFAQSLLTAYWIDQLGLSYAPSNHHFRLRLCSLFSLYGLACPALSVPQTERLEMKQILFVSLGHMVVSPGPLLTLGANRLTSGTQRGDHCSPLLGLFHRIHTLSKTAVSEAEECLVAAYRRRVYTKICEFTKFVDRLKYADIFLLVSMELVHWRTIVIHDDFDSVLEDLSGAAKEQELVANKIAKITDCRDFSVSPNFDPPLEHKTSKEESFSHAVAWIQLRMLTVRAIFHCTQLVMSTVKLSEALLTTPDSEIRSQSDNKALDALQRLDEDKQLLSDLVHRNNSPSIAEFVDIDELLSSLVLPTDQLLATPTQLPKMPPLSFYLSGPYKAVLESGTCLMIGVHRLLVNGLEAFPESDQNKALCALENPFSNIPQLVTDDHCPDWSKLPCPKLNSGAGYLTNSLDAHSPAVVLLFLAMLYETFALDCLFVSMVRSVLRPRSHSLQLSNKRQRRKAAKARKAKGVVESVGKNDTINGEDRKLSIDVAVFKRLDQIGSNLLSVANSMSQSLTSLLEVVDAWLQWSRTKATRDLMDLSMALCEELFSQELLTQYPVMRPTTTAPIFAGIATSYEESFGRLSVGFRSKLTNLGHVINELQVYEFSDKLAACHIDEPETCRGRWGDDATEPS